jgi:2TM domain
MTTNEIEESTREREDAVVRLKKQRDFQGHLVAYLVVNTAVWVVWALTGAGYPWPAWLTGLWGIGLLMNAWDVYFRQPITETDIEREIDRARSAH